MRIHDGRGGPVGLGFLISDDLFVTCAHVVSAALGIALDEAPAPSAAIQVDLPLLRESAAHQKTAAGRGPLAALVAALLPLLEPDLSTVDRISRIPELVAVVSGGGFADVVAPILSSGESRRLLIVVDQFEELLAHEDEAVVDLLTGRTLENFKTGDDSIGIECDPSGHYFALLRHGSVVELWRVNPLRKEIGPLYSLSFGGDTEDSSSPYVFMDVSANGKTLLYANAKAGSAARYRWTRNSGHANSVPLSATANSLLPNATSCRHGCHPPHCAQLDDRGQGEMWRAWTRSMRLRTGPVR